MPNTCLLSYIAKWIGPFDTTWNSGQCSLIDDYEGYSLEQCKRKCIEVNCNAINYSEGGHCDLQSCPLPIPTPSFDYTRPDSKGYYVQTGIILEI